MKVHNENIDTFHPYQGIQPVIDRLNELAKKSEYVFRGYGKQDEMIPKIIRAKDYTNLEGKLLKDFEKYGSSYFHAATPIDFMSYAQHFGLPTRLLDFTYNPFIALSFALYSPKSNGKYSNEEDKTYYFIRYASIEENIVLQTLPVFEDKPIEQQLQRNSLAVQALQAIQIINAVYGYNPFNYSTDLFYSAMAVFNGINEKIFAEQKIRNRTILFVDPNQSNQRIVMQQGLFMFPYALNNAEHKKILNDNSYYIKIHKDLRNDLIRYLDTLGYNTFRLMPDLSSICEAIKRRNLDERAEKSNAFKNKGEWQ